MADLLAGGPPARGRVVRRLPARDRHGAHAVRPDRHHRTGRRPVRPPDADRRREHGAVLRDRSTPSPKHSQFYSMLGTRAIWRDGWQANTVHPADPRGGATSTGPVVPVTTSPRTATRCTTSPRNDPNCSTNSGRCGTSRPAGSTATPWTTAPHAELLAAEAAQRQRRGATAALPRRVRGPRTSPSMIGRSFPISPPSRSTTRLRRRRLFRRRPLRRPLPVPQSRRPALRLQLARRTGTTPQRPEPLAPAACRGVEFAKTGTDGRFPTGTATLYIDGDVVATQHAVQPGFFSLSGEGNNVGRDRGQPVSNDYAPPCSPARPSTTSCSSRRRHLARPATRNPSGLPARLKARIGPKSPRHCPVGRGGMHAGGS